MKSIIIYGASGHGKVIAAAAASGNLSVEYFLDDDDRITGFLGYPVVQKSRSDIKVFLGIGNNQTRKTIVERNQYQFADAVIDPSAIINTDKKIGTGTLIAAGAVINPDASIGKFAIINTSAVIEHDCKVGDYAHISPNATLSGGVVVGEGTHIGSGAVIIPGVKVGKWCTIGAGTVVIKDVEDHCTAVGNPARIIHKDG